MKKLPGWAKKIKGKVSVPISTDNLSHRIDLFLNEQSDQLIEDWDLATKKDLSALEKRFKVVSTDIESLEKRFNQYRGATNKKLENIEERLEKLENPEEKPKKIKVRHVSRDSILHFLFFSLFGAILVFLWGYKGSNQGYCPRTPPEF
nr:hypothetical protein [Methanobacterium formicicum]